MVFFILGILRLIFIRVVGAKALNVDVGSWTGKTLLA